MKRLLSPMPVVLVLLVVAGSGAAALAAKDPNAAPQRVLDARMWAGTESGEVALSRSGMAILAVTTEWRGTSYVSSNHNTPLTYLGKARAMANIWNNQRWIRASFKYSRGGQDVINWQHSNATVNAFCQWTAGSEKSHTVWDSLDPNAPVTKWHWSFVYTSPSVC